MNGMEMQAYGADGVLKVIRILEREILLGMRMLGARSVSELVPEMVSTSLLLPIHASSSDFCGAQVERVDWDAISPKL